MCCLVGRGGLGGPACGACSPRPPSQQSRLGAGVAAALGVLAPPDPPPRSRHWVPGEEGRPPRAQPRGRGRPQVPALWLGLLREGALLGCRRGRAWLGCRLRSLAIGREPFHRVTESGLSLETSTFSCEITPPCWFCSAADDRGAATLFWHNSLGIATLNSLPSLSPRLRCAALRAGPCPWAPVPGRVRAQPVPAPAAPL